MSIKITNSEIYAEAERLFCSHQRKPKGSKNIGELGEILGFKTSAMRIKLRGLLEKGAIQAFDVKENATIKKYYLPTGKKHW